MPVTHLVESREIMVIAARIEGRVVVVAGRREGGGGEKRRRRRGDGWSHAGLSVHEASAFPADA
jgi:hypothetical protein